MRARTCKHAHIHKDIHAHTHIYMLNRGMLKAVSKITLIEPQLSIYIHTLAHTCMHVHTHINMTHPHTHTHTHTYAHTK